MLLLIPSSLATKVKTKCSQVTILQASIQSMQAKEMTKSMSQHMSMISMEMLLLLIHLGRKTTMNQSGMVGKGMTKFGVLMEL